eukprot:m.63120 g.63120  ORF g.63120 m.63120 type:complete len:207 (+) comp35145_c2_seq6:178-798(+)
MPTYKLTYFNVRARAELARLIFAQGGVAYEDKRIAGDDWKQLKPSTPFGQLPILEVDGVVIAQSQAINRYAAEVAGLAGSTCVEKARAHMVVESIVDVFKKLVEARFEKDETKKHEKFEALKETDIPTFLNFVEKLLVANGGGNGWLIGSKITYADLALFNFFDTIRGKIDPFTSGATPKTAELVKRVEDLPKIKEWLSSRPKTDF